MIEDCAKCENKGWLPEGDRWGYCSCAHGSYMRNRHKNLTTVVAASDPEILKFRHTGDIGYVQKPPSSWYQSEEIFQLEQERIFNDGWFCVGPAEMVHDGGYRVPAHLPFPVVLTKENGNLHAFHNVCLHHKAEVASGIDTRAGKMTCKYHGWTYGLDGKLKGTPHLKERPPCLAAGLSEMSVAQVGPLLFVNRKPGVVFDASIMDCDFSWDNMRTVDARTYTIDCNWKIYIENYLDGGYHVPTIHKTLTGQLDLSSYNIEVKDGYVVQSVEGDGEGDFQSRIGDRALYVWKHPNLMINRYGPWLTAVSVIPLSPTQTKVKAYYFIELEYEMPGGCGGYEYIKKSIEASAQVTAEDIDICESAQIGACATPDDRGVYVPKFESGQFYFHQRLAEALV
jgi:choline monooxygenase